MKKTATTLFFLLLTYINFGQNNILNKYSVIDSSNYIKILAEYLDTSYLSRYENEIKEYELEDSVKGIKKNKVLFVGSSSFRKWKNIEKDLYPIPVINRGFGGSTMPELDYFFFRLVKPYNPSAIVVYEGDNDVLAPFLTPEVILLSFHIFVKLTETHLPGGKIFFVSIKPSPSREKYIQKMKTTNRLIQNYCKNNKNLFYIDITKNMFTENGQIREDIFRKDRLHLNEKGYKIWSNIIKNKLLKFL